MYCDFVRCKNCGSTYAFQASMPMSRLADPAALEMESETVILSCPECEHVYSYADPEQHSELAPWGEQGYQGKTPTIFSVQLECDAEDCRIQTTVIAPRKADTTRPMLEDEYPSWVLHDLKCKKGHALLGPESHSV